MKHIAFLTAASSLCSMATDPNVALGTTLDPAASLGAGGPVPAPVTLGDGTPSPAPAPATLGDGTAPAPAPAADPNTFEFVIPNTETRIGINIAAIPAEIRMDFLKKGLRDYIVNSVNQANLRAKKANEPFDAYDEAMKANPLQEAVKKPEGERATADLIKTAADARERLYKGEVRKQGEAGEGKRRETVDPLTKLVTEAVVRELHEKDKAAGGRRKYVEFTAEVGKAGGGVKYLEAKIADKIAAAPEAERANVEAVLRKFMDERYVKPAQMMLGQKTNKATDAANSIL